MGSRVRVFRLAECKWFHGSVDATGVQDGLPIFHVIYNDGKDGWVSAFGKDTWQFVDAASAEIGSSFSALQQNQARFLNSLIFLDLNPVSQFLRPDF